MGNGAEAHGAKAAQLARRTAEHRIGRKAPQKLRVVVVERKHEAQGIDARVAVGAQDDRAVGTLPGPRAL